MTTTQFFLKEQIVAVIGARGGSKGLARKNVRILNGKPLLAWTIEAARGCKLIDRVIVSTDDPKIAKIANRWGAETPFLRPAALSADDVPSIAFLQHAIDWLEAVDHYFPKILVYLQITDVFRRKGLIDAVVSRLINQPELDTVFAAYPTHKNFWRRVNGSYQRICATEDKVRQHKAPIFREDTGIACATRVHVVKSGHRIGKNVDIVVNNDFLSSIDIHDEFDLSLAELVSSAQIYKINE